MSEYEIQGNEFLKSTGTTMTVGAPDYRRHFQEDKECRYVFPVTFERDGRSFTVQFGQSLANGDKEPTAYDVLSCLTSCDPGSFEDFCADFGYDTDSRRAYNTYLACYKEWTDVQYVFGDRIDELSEIR